MEKSDWEARWREGRIGFHQSEINPYLVEHGDFLAGGRTERVLVPLCGKSRDMDWLRGHFDEVVGVEIVEDGVRAWFEEHEEPYRRDHHDVGVQYSGRGITLYAADIFDIHQGVLGRVDAVYDRAALVALPLDMRRRYATHLAGMLEPGARMLLVTLEYDPEATDGPPFAVNPDHVRELYARDFELEYFEGEPADGLPPRFEGVPVNTGVWELRRR